MKIEEIEHRTKTHPPQNELTAMSHDAVRDSVRSLWLLLNEIVPESEEKQAAFVNLEMTMFWANAAVARYPKGIEETGGGG